MHIAIVGNIGAGKTTLTGLLARHYKCEPVFETVDNNPYLEDFYNDMKRWSFNLQIFFLNARFQQLSEIREKEHLIIQDRTIYEDAYIFANNLHDMGLMTSRDYNNYLGIFQSIIQFVKPPDLLIYLKASVPTLVSNIQRRGREYEVGIRLDYLNKLNEKYEAWIGGYTEGKLLVVNQDKLNPVDKPEDLGTIIQSIEAELHGLF
ncbi:deoxyadenosine/deoxycytidine kinase [Anseongella ginsenosidimutans]|uniref:Deoxyadenosine/deoxycytidine kinase n=1 Tax=Anseongella ginsenosidimutans TaxID=496056 RepID=A0A4R3KQ42_9SPHI|nr:deoxynucleoside kinase [Anseongella ginsenosidimutans]QEC52751.1 ATP-binding cassette domain-containing protein [Anseongella ginsenosidimutans]TCS85508.1 deoxyadenosine/deoxycytidine kinase [Anseongella ginsenosidimutans]